MVKKKAILANNKNTYSMDIFTQNINIKVRLILVWVSFLAISTTNFDFIFQQNKNSKFAKFGVGFLFFDRLSSNWRKKSHPLGVLARNPCKPLYSVSFFNIVTPDHSLTLTKQKRSHPQLPNLKIETNNQLNVER